MNVMVEQFPAQQNRSMLSVAAIVADSLGLLFFWLTSGYFIGRFGRNSVDMAALGTAGLFILVYILFLVGMVLIRKQASDHTPIQLLANRSVVPPVAVGFALTFVMIVAHLTGYLSLIFDINFGDMGNSYYFLVTPAVYLVIGLLYLFIVTQPISADKSNLTNPFLGLLFTNLFIATCASYIAATKGSLFTDWSAWGIGIATFLILTVFFLLPRLIHYDKTRDLVSLISFDVMAIILAVLVVAA